MTSDDVPPVVLRHFCPEDALVHLRGEDEAITRWLSGGVSTEDSVSRWIQSNGDNWSSDGPRFAFAIQSLVGELMGVVEVNVDHSHFAGLEPGDANVSYGLYPQHRGKGFATSAVRHARDFMISKGVKRAVIRVEPENVNSIRLAERCGYEATRHRYERRWYRVSRVRRQSRRKRKWPITPAITLRFMVWGVSRQARELGMVLKGAFRDSLRCQASLRLGLGVGP
jgi:RimJ/RimL family protein N-acetyltransferase